MLTIPGYQINKKIYESDNTFVFRALRNQDNQPIIFKALKEDYPSTEDILRYKQEYEITRSLEPLPGVIGTYGLEKHRNTPVMVIEDFGAKSLSILMNSERFSLKEFLTIAIRLADILGEIHTANVIHKDINPSNIVLNRASGQLKIIDFGISAVLPNENPGLKNPEVIEGTLAYIAPEQTGRMNRSMDYRTDYYSLGATFYELLLNRPPFNGTDPMGLVHCHMARQPEPPHEIDNEIPKVVSDIVMKLLSKNAGERYQSARSIKVDLEKCLENLHSDMTVSAFPISHNDISSKFQIPKKLYGREHEIETLWTAFKRVSGGKSELLLVSGYSGIGKTTLVQEMYKPIIQQQGYFISGDYDQLQRNIPYRGLIHAFQELIRQLLTESEKQITVWKERLLKALGPNGQVIIDVIPEVELIIGPQPQVANLPPAETQNRFNLVFQNFIQVFTQPEFPVVIFLDDLQWADADSLRLIKLIVTASDSRSLLFIGAYRDNEVNAAHPLTHTLDEIKKTEAVITFISLTPLNLSHVNQFISDTLHCSPETTLPLAKLVRAKTDGNPFFMGEFLKSLYKEKLLKFDCDHLRWRWSVKEIRVRNITNNVVEFIVNNIQNLTADLQQVLKLASCIGNQFDLKTLAIIYDKPQKETEILLQEALSEGLILPLGEEYKSIELDVHEIVPQSPALYRFSHDRIQQGVYSLIPETQREFIHLKVGRLLLQENPPGMQEHKIFDIVSQLNYGIELISQDSERYELARLNLIAGKKAKAAAAYEHAFGYLEIGIELIAPKYPPFSVRENQEVSSWRSHYDLTLALHVEAAEAAYLCTKFKKMERLVHVILGQAHSLLDKVKAYEIKIQACIAQNKSLEGVKTGLTALKLLEVSFPKKPNKLNILFALLRTKSLLAGKKIEDLIDLPEMNDPIKLAIIRVLMNLGTAAYFSAPELFPLIVFKGVELSIRHGNSPESTIAYSSYGIILCAVLGNVEAGNKFGQLGLRLLSRFDVRKLKARAFEMVNSFVKHWEEHLKKGLEISLEAFQCGLETGDFEWAAYAAQNYCSNSFIVGKELKGLEQEFEKYNGAISLIKQEIPLHQNKMSHQAVLNLTGQSEDPCRLIGKQYDEQEMLPHHLQANDGNSIFVLYLNKALLCYLFQRLHQAVENITAAEKYLENVAGKAVFPLFHFYDSLSLLAVFPEAQKPEQKCILKKVAVNQKKMKKWAHHAPMNYLHKFYLVEAERCRILCQEDKAMNFYDQAINLSKKHEYINEEALANELAARFYMGREKVDITKGYLQDARYCYLRWGAMAKVKDLDASYPEFFDITQPEEKTDVKTPNSATDTTVNGSGEDLDLISVMKISQVISEEIVLGKLLDKLIKIVIENTGAQKGFLILKSNEKLFIEAEGTAGRENVIVLNSAPVDKAENLSAAIINYVARTHKCVVLNDAVFDGLFTRDPYILAHLPKSILCGPLLHKSKLIGILYLENNFVTGAFTNRRLKSVKLLSSQIAVSLENARLYENMKNKTEEIKSANLKLSREIEQRKKAETELTRYRDDLEELVTQRTAQLQESRHALANLKRGMKKRRHFHSMVGKSDRMQEIYTLIEYLTNVSATVLITGESGTGKELVAKAIHCDGNRRDKPFIEVNCSALSESVLESELFGHVKGAFTGADRDKIGRFQKAGDGTIFLDEIGDISPYFQKRLLRVLQEREFEQVGDTTPRKMEARIVAATNQDLFEKVKRGEFREDLYYRLRVVELNLPPLRDRKEDIPLLVDHFLSCFSDELDKEITDVSKEVLKLFMEYHWPGNIRELRNTLEHICILCNNSVITYNDLPVDFEVSNGYAASSEINKNNSSGVILQALEKARWNKTRAAQLLGISRRTLYRRIENQNIMAN